ncbi:hypothetical protein NDU88_001370 [Pleurodeles waltl]|uniref:Reverse transcriptase domain-containing protein n=1 Tax=Pleurodeles waltl TaxID=8319 RepID=A0AAV7U7Q3_PLEWA|nr:hypothetical protein NDU88_001370 [Pleurodeles waltl]
MPQSLHEGMIMLFCKQKGEKEDLKNWRPISLLNVDYTLLVKAMANRLKKVVEKIADPDQTCGIPGRQMADSLALVQDMIQYIKSRKVPTALVSLDQERPLTAPPMSSWTGHSDRWDWVTSVTW